MNRGGSRGGDDDRNDGKSGLRQRKAEDRGKVAARRIDRYHLLTGTDRGCARHDGNGKRNVVIHRSRLANG